MGRAELPIGEGMLLPATGSIQMTFMRFPIDAVFLDRELGVMGVAENVRPWRFAGRRGAKHVLELPAGEAGRRGLRAGVQLRLIEPATAPVAAAAGVEPPQSSRIRVLLGASDRRFLRVASFLLGRNGFSVASATRFADFMRAIERSEPDVVVLDASPPARWTTRAAVALQGTPAEVQVLLLTDEPTSGIPHVLPKWGSFDRLTDEIRRVHGRDLTDALPA
jgi:CheY-like chemotaxis protein